MRVRSLRSSLAGVALGLAALMAAAPPASAADAPLSALDRRLASGEIVVKVAKSAPTVYELDVYGNVEAPQETVWAAITSYDRYGEFLPLVTESSLQSRSGARVRQLVKMTPPWPFPKHWFVNACVENKAAGVLSWTMAEGTPKYEQGYWQLVPRGASKTRLRYHLSVDPWMDSVPAWVVSMVTQVTMPDVVKGVRRRAALLAGR